MKSNCRERGLLSQLPNPKGHPRERAVILHLEEGRWAEQVSSHRKTPLGVRGKCRRTPCRQKRAALQNSLVARLLEELSHAGWDTVEGFYIWRVIGLFPATLLDSLGSQGRLGDDKGCDPKTQQKKRKSTCYTSALAAPHLWPSVPKPTELQ